MPRVARVDVGGEVYHVLNRAIGRLQIFNTPSDYQLFFNLLEKAQTVSEMRILSFVVMPNHWHLELYPRNDGDMGRFMHCLTNSHTRHVHACTQTEGTGSLYQGRYKSFIVEDDTHLLTVLKYIERNPVRAKLVKKVEEWKWGSAWIRLYGSAQQRSLLTDPPVDLPADYESWINTSDSESALEDIRKAANRGRPFGGERWVDQMVATHNLSSTTRNRGRPKKV